MKYLNTLWTSQPYPATKKWFWYRCADLPEVDLYVTKDKRRGALKLPDKLYKVAVTENEGKLIITGIYPKFAVSGSEVKAWMNREQNAAIAADDMIWAAGAKRKY